MAAPASWSRSCSAPAGASWCCCSCSPRSSRCFRCCRGGLDPDHVHARARLTTFTDVSIIVQFLVALIGLGVAIDYSLLLVSRWREERATAAATRMPCGRDEDGRSRRVGVGVTVAISLLALVVVPVPALRSVARRLLIPLVSAAVLTLLPALLSSVGPRVDYPRIRHEGTASRGWSAWARLVVRHRTAPPPWPSSCSPCSSSRSSASSSASRDRLALARTAPATTRCARP